MGTTEEKANKLINYLTNCFVTLLQDLLTKLGKSVGRFPWIYLICTSVVFVCCFAGMVRLRMVDNVRKGYTPDNTRSIQEWAVYKKFFKENEPFIFKLFVRAKDRRSMVRLKYLARIRNLNEHVMKRCSVVINGTRKTFSDVCGSYCEINDVIYHFELGLENQLSRHAENKSLSSKIRLSYPTSIIIGHKYNLAPYFYGAKVHKFDWRKPSAIEKVDLIMLHYRADRSTPQVKQMIEAWEENIENCLRPFKNDLLLDVMYLGDAIITAEVVRTGLTLLPYLVVGFFTLLIFVTATVILSAVYHNQMHWSKIIISVAAVISPLMAVGAGMGLMFWANYRFGAILSCIPFLVLAIGVDDAFLMMHAWNRLTDTRNSKNQLTISDKLGQTVREVGPSITITSLTNALAFGIGAFTPTPEIRLFCAATAICITVDFAFEFTIFGAILALCGRYENTSINTSKTKRKQVLVALGNFFTKLQRIYCNFLSNTVTFVIVIILVGIYASAAIWGTFTMQASLTPKKLFIRDSPLIEVDHLREKYIWNEYYETTIFVSKPPDIRNKKQLDRFFEMVRKFELLENGLGNGTTELWLLDYKSFHNQITGCGWPLLEESIEFNCTLTYESLDIFFQWPEFIKWNSYVHWHTKKKFNKADEYIVDEFAFTTAYFNMSSWNKRVELMVKVRQLADNYSEFQISPFEPDAYLLDQILSLKSVTLQTVLITFGCMAVVCLIFIPSLCGVLFASLAIASISIGVLGFLSWWNVDLDPISMATTVMSIGFSVDFTAHVSFHYYKTGQEQVLCPTQVDRLMITLTAIGWPMLQAGFSTVLIVTTLTLIDTYMAEVFVKTIILVVSLGLIHGLFILPVILSALPNCLTGRRMNLTATNQNGNVMSELDGTKKDTSKYSADNENKQKY